MKNFIIDVDFVMSKRFEIEAENKEQARRIISLKLLKDPYEYARQFDELIGHKIIDVTEE